MLASSEVWIIEIAAMMYTNADISLVEAKLAEFEKNSGQLRNGRLLAMLTWCHHRTGNVSRAQEYFKLAIKVCNHTSQLELSQ